MGSSDGVSSGSSEGGTNVDERKRRKMISNRESARRLRMKKRKHANDLAAEVGQLVAENRRIVDSLNLTGGLYLDVEAENSVLRAQVAELSSRLEWLNGIINYVSSTNVLCGRTQGNVDSDLRDGIYVNVNNRPMMAHVGSFM